MDKRKITAEEVKARVRDNAIAEEQREAAFIDHFERVAVQRVCDEIGKPFVEAGLVGVDEPAAVAAERERVAALIERDRADRVSERDRKAAALQVSEGVTVNIADAVIEPTPEWKEQGDFRTFTPRLEQGTVRTVKAYRRVSVPMVLRLWSKGKINDDQLRACIWYREAWEQAGLIGRFKSSHISLTGNTGGSGGIGQAPMALQQREAEARDGFRQATAAIAPVLVKMFQAIVLHDMPLARARRFIRCRNGQEFQRFLAACQDLVAHIESNSIEIMDEDDDEGI
ncbi:MULTISPECIES: hypothetical protein [unclassified Novosphingobium]|uniref:hypothetical protein n=1 Tax=unclassified Novosphingobium TaxID=2644732 RepID=UPI00105F2D7B|nr:MULTISPECIES: hypothetical protein [unclassified Novosphingobium]